MAFFSFFLPCPFFSINGEKIELNKDDLVVVEPGERHHIIEKSKDLLLLLLMPPPVLDDKNLRDRPVFVSLIAPGKGPAQLRLIDPVEIIRIVNDKGIRSLTEEEKKAHNL